LQVSGPGVLFEFLCELEEVFASLSGGRGGKTKITCDGFQSLPDRSVRVICQGHQREFRRVLPFKPFFAIAPAHCLPGTSILLCKEDGPSFEPL
jgi:hypothetical protein